MIYRSWLLLPLLFTQLQFAVLYFEHYASDVSIQEYRYVVNWVCLPIVWYSASHLRCMRVRVDQLIWEGFVDFFSYFRQMQVQRLKLNILANSLIILHSTLYNSKSWVSLNKRYEWNNRGPVELSCTWFEPRTHPIQTLHRLVFISMLHMLLDKTFESDYKNTWNDSSKTMIDIS